MKRVGIEENQDTWDVVTWECVQKTIADFAGRFLESRDRVSGQGLGKVETKCGWRKKLVWGSELSSGVQGEEEDGLAFCLRHNKDASGPGPHAPAIETSRGLGWRVWVFGVVLTVLPLGKGLTRGFSNGKWLAMTGLGPSGFREHLDESLTRQ